MRHPIRHAGGFEAIAQSADGWATKPAYEIYLQGSYRSDTNTHGASDVDVVVQLNS